MYRALKIEIQYIKGNWCISGAPIRSISPLLYSQEAWSDNKTMGYQTKITDVILTFHHFTYIILSMLTRFEPHWCYWGLQQQYYISWPWMCSSSFIVHTKSHISTIIRQILTKFLAKGLICDQQSNACINCP